MKTKTPAKNKTTASRTAKAVGSGPLVRRSFETFRRPDAYVESQLTQHEPSCFNGQVSVRRYRVTFEEVEEPGEVLIERVRKLWRETDNFHHWEPLQATARELGIELLHDEQRRALNAQGEAQPPATKL